MCLNGDIVHCAANFLYCLVIADVIERCGEILVLSCSVTRYLRVKM